jgi:hypothetical protein
MRGYIEQVAIPEWDRKCRNEEQGARGDMARAAGCVDDAVGLLEDARRQIREALSQIGNLELEIAGRLATLSAVLPIAALEEITKELEDWRP